MVNHRNWPSNNHNWSRIRVTKCVHYLWDDDPSVKSPLLLDIILSNVVGIGNSDKDVTWDSSETLLLLTSSALCFWTSGFSTFDFTKSWAFNESGTISFKFLADKLLCLGIHLICKYQYMFKYLYCYYPIMLQKLA